jgi:hypothetical protein
VAFSLSMIGLVVAGGVLIFRGELNLLPDVDFSGL